MSRRSAARGRSGEPGARPPIPVWVVLLAIALLLLACRTGAPPGAVAGRPERGTIAGRLTGPLDSGPIAGRLVEAVEVTTAARYSTKTTVSGGFTLFVPPGRYRLYVALGRGERLIEEPGVLRLGPGGFVDDAELVLGGAGMVGEP
jgi:hypothetical protein